MDLSIYFQCSQSKVAIRSIANDRYLNYDNNSKKLKADQCHPCLKVKIDDSQVQDELIKKQIQKLKQQMTVDSFRICSYRDKNSEVPISLGQEVFLESENGDIVVVHQNGDIQLINELELLSFPETQQNIYSFQKKLVIQSDKQSSSRKNVSFLDDVVFKCTNGMYLSTDENGVLVGNGENTIQDKNRFRIEKAGSLKMPDEYYLRSNMNCNYLNPFLNENIVQMSENQTDQVNMELYKINQDKKTLSQYSIKDQEILLIDDLLNIFLGIEGSFIKRVKLNDIKHSIKHCYKVEPYLGSPSCDNGLLQMTEKLLILAEHNDILQLFASINHNIDKGLVLQYFSQALKTVLREYQLLVIQLESLFNNDQLTLQQMWFYLQQTINSFQQLVNTLIVEPRTLNLHSTLLLETLFMGVSMSNDQQTLQIFKYLLQEAQIPFAELMKRYLVDGIVDDVNNEFIVVEQQNNEKTVNGGVGNVSGYWYNKYSINREIIKQTNLVTYRVFNPNIQNKILQTIKYINLQNILTSKQRFNHENDYQFEDEIQCQINDSFQNQDFELLVEKAFNRANNRLMHQINSNYQLKTKIQELKKIYFSQKGDIIECLLESLGGQMETNIKQVNIENVNSLLYMAIKMSTVNNSIYNEKIQLIIGNFNIYEQIYQLEMLQVEEKDKLGTLIRQNVSLVECFNITVVLEQPLDLLVSQQNQIKYQIIFRQLFYIKYIENQLVRIWQQNQNIKKVFIFSGSSGLLYKMISLVRQIMDYYTNQVLELAFVQFMDCFKSSSSFDQIIDLHQQFIDNCIKNMFVTDVDLFLQINKILNLCLSFTNNVFKDLTEYHVLYQNMQSKYTRNQRKDYGSVNVQIKKQQEQKEFKKFIEENRIDENNQQYQENFENRIRNLIQCLKSKIGQDGFSGQIQVLLSKIDEQNYYQMKFGLQGYEEGLDYNQGYKY